MGVQRLLSHAFFREFSRLSRRSTGYAGRPGLRRASRGAWRPSGWHQKVFGSANLAAWSQLARKRPRRRDPSTPHRSTGGIPRTALRRASPAGPDPILIPES